MMKGNSGSGAAEADVESASVPIANAPNARNFEVARREFSFK